jgi:hypothetical protein
MALVILAVIVLYVVFAVVAQQGGSGSAFCALLSAQHEVSYVSLRQLEATACSTETQVDL